MPAVIFKIVIAFCGDQIFAAHTFVTGRGLYAEGNVGEVTAFFQQAEFEIDAGIEAVRIAEYVRCLTALAQGHIKRFGELKADEAVNVGINGSDADARRAGFVHACAWDCVQAKLSGHVG